MTDFPNITRLAQGDPNKLTARELQVNLIRQDYETPARGSMRQVDKDARMTAAVPALLFHIDDLYGQIEYLHKKLNEAKA